MRLSRNPVLYVNTIYEQTAASGVTVDGVLLKDGGVTLTGGATLVADVLIEDQLVLLASGTTGAAAKDAGLIVDRGDDNNMGIVFDESADVFAVIQCNSEDGTTDGNVTIDDYAPLRVGALTADDASTFTGGLVADALDAIAANALTVGAATATSVEIADTGVETDIQGTLSVDEAATFDSTLTAATSVGSAIFQDVAGTGPADAPYGFTGKHMPIMSSLQIEHSDLTAASTTETIDIFTASQDCIVLSVWFNLATVFSGGVASNVQVEIGDDEDPDSDRYMTITEIHTGDPTGNIIGGAGVAFDGTDSAALLSSGQKVQAKFTATGDDVADLTQGDLTVYVLYMELG